MESRPKRLCLVGGSGLVGSRLIAMTGSRSDIRLIGVSRREIELPPDARLEVLLADVSGWRDAIFSANADVLVCALGTTMRKSGKDEAAFRSVDFDLVMSCAHWAKEAGIEHMIAVSSIGADMSSRHIYLRVKGEVEQALSKLHFKRLDLLRPGLLRGPRSEVRPTERFAQAIAPAADLFLQGSLRRFRSVDAHTLATAIVGLARQRVRGRFIHDYDAILQAVRRDRG